MGGLLAVAAGSNQPPVFIHLTYKPKGAKKTVVLIGKGITFDSGGLNIKTGTIMNNMKDDMSGGAAVLGLFPALRKIDLPVAVHGLDSPDREHVRRQRDEGRRRVQGLWRQDR